jgi:SulP family sulfate permease
VKDLLGACGDLPVLIPLLALLAQVPGYTAPGLLISAALVSWASAVWFRVPISIQPLKSVAIAALALGATGAEIRFSGLGIGIVFLTLGIFRRQPLPIPEALVRAVQAGLGVLLVQQGWKQGQTLDLPTLTISLFSVGILWILEHRTRLPLLGLSAGAAFIEACIRARAPVSAPPTLESGVRLPILLALILPQLALTSTNSISGARLALSTYFPEAIRNVGQNIERRLLLSIGLGNCLMAAFCGMPFCHGAGGITAHAKAGARSFWMNWILGALLLGLASIAFRTGYVPVLDPRAHLVLLVLIGVHHFNLARPVLEQGFRGKSLIVGSMCLAAWSGNLLYCIGLAAFWRPKPPSPGALHA